MTNVTERSSKADIIDGALEYCDHLESTRMDRSEVVRLSIVWCLIGLAAGLVA